MPVLTLFCIGAGNCRANLCHLFVFRHGHLLKTTARAAATLGCLGSLAPGRGVRHGRSVRDGGGTAGDGRDRGCRAGLGAGHARRSVGLAALGRLEDVAVLRLALEITAI